MADTAELATTDSLINFALEGGSSEQLADLVAHLIINAITTNTRASSRSININDSSIQYPLQDVHVPIPTHLPPLTRGVHSLPLHEVRVEITREVRPVRQEKLATALLQVILEIA